MKNFNELMNAYTNHELTNFLKGCTDEELKTYLIGMSVDDIVGYKVNIVNAIYQEMEYRESDILSKTKKR